MKGIINLDAESRGAKRIEESNTYDFIIWRKVD